MDTRKKILHYIFFHRLRYRILILALSLVGAVFGLLAPWLQKIFIDDLTGAVPKENFLAYFNLPAFHVLFVFALAILLQVLSYYLNLLAFIWGYKEALVLQKNLAVELYQKLLSLREDASQRQSVGEVVSLYTVDIPGATILLEQSVPSGATCYFPILIAPWFISSFYQIPIASVVAVIAIIFLLNSLLAVRQARFFLAFKGLAADRIGLASEWIQSIKQLRILGWIHQMEERIIGKRIVETKNRVGMVTNGQMMNSLSSSSTFLVNLAALYALLISRPEKAATAGEVLSLFWILGVFLTRPFRILPWFMTFVFDGLTSSSRLADFFAKTNPPSAFDKLEPSKAEHKSPSPTAKPLSLVVENLTAPDFIQISNLNLKAQGSADFLLRDINLKIKPGEFIGICGEVGSGKSLLLKSLMGETAAEFLSYSIGGQSVLELNKSDLRKNFCFVSQEGFIMSASLRDNVHLSYLADTAMDQRVRRSLTAADLDLNLFNDDLDTAIGERGVNLSGGQKQRVNIARAHFYSRPCILLDDSLSALDIKTEERIIKNLLLGDWKRQTRLLATHRLSALKHTDRVVFLEKGKIQAILPFNELLMKSKEFQRFCELNNKTNSQDLIT